MAGPDADDLDAVARRRTKLLWPLGDAVKISDGTAVPVGTARATDVRAAATSWLAGYVSSTLTPAVDAEMPRAPG